MVGGIARRIFFETAIQEFAVPEATITKIRAFLPRLALKVGVETTVLKKGRAPSSCLFTL